MHFPKFHLNFKCCSLLILLEQKSCSEHLVLDVEVEALDVNEEGDDEEDVDNGKGDEGVVEGGLHLGTEEDQDGGEVPDHPNDRHHRHAHLG